MSREGDRQSGVIGYWRAVELFSPQQVPDADPADRVYDSAAGPMPWDPDHRERRIVVRPGRIRQHIVYGGLFELTAVRQALLEAFGGNEEDFDGRIRGRTALYALTVTDEGWVVPGSLVISSCGWATGRAQRRKRTEGSWLNGFDADAQRVTDLLMELADDPATGRRRTDHAILQQFALAIAQLWGVADTLRPHGLRVKTVERSQKQAELPEADDFLNSFYAADLAQVAEAVQREGAGTALTTYLTENAHLETRRRQDVRLRPELVLDGVEPAKTPLGRWPGRCAEPLVLSQQFAVNAARSELSDGGLFAVNGPPGTGKTTTLRDCFADLIVERAVRLAALVRPSEAFEGKLSWRTGDYTRTVHTLIPELTGFEMVVASANNTAVENISREIPDREKGLGEEWREGADYFAAQATCLLDGKDAWGLIAARLGKKSNRSEFVDRVWYGGKQPEAATGLRELLDSYIATPQTGVWVEAKERFRSAVDQVEQLRAARAEAADAWRTLPASERAVDDARQAVAAAVDNLARCRRFLEPLAVAASERSVESERASARRAEHGARRPGFWMIVSTLGRAARDWQAEDRLLAERLYEIEAAAADARALADEARSAVATAEARVTGCRASEAEADATVSLLQAIVSSARDAWPQHVPAATWLQDEELRELSAPWSDRAICAARSALFLAALDLHKAFIRCTARTMRGNLAAAMDVVAGRVPRELGPDKRLAAWQSLFLVVPVVSTTFASLDRVFAGLGREALGWMFIDEAGQAAPQQAVGALWRARKVMVVGDPQQLEPVVTLPWTAQQALRREFGVEQEWAPGWTSVQQLADRGMAFGTLLPTDLPDGSTKVWVGAPLRVHRRCDDPMFGISNAVAYDGLMIAGTPDRKPYSYSPPSCWVDVKAPYTEGHWVPEEGRVLRQILERLSTTDGIVMDQDVFVISPFRRVADGARRQAVGLLARDRVGTVHTTQGKEADVVILVLGTDRQSVGARAWAAGRPNLLNVAVSRARRRLFVIGDLEAWGGQRYFDVLAGSLPRRSWTSASGL